MKLSLAKPAALGICGSALFLLSSSAPALEPSAQVKAKTILKTTKAWNGQKIVYPRGEAEITAVTIEIVPGGSTGWHLHPVPSFGYVLQGRLDVKLKDGRVKVLKPGDALVEVTSTLHNGRNMGKNPVKLIVFYAGVKDGKLTVKEPAAKK